MRFLQDLLNSASRNNKLKHTFFQIRCLPPSIREYHFSRVHIWHPSMLNKFIQKYLYLPPQYEQSVSPFSLALRINAMLGLLNCFPIFRIHNFQDHSSNAFFLTTVVFFLHPGAIATAICFTLPF